MEPKQQWAVQDGLVTKIWELICLGGRDKAEDTADTVQMGAGDWISCVIV